MATTTATVTITSSDIMDNSVSISNSNTLYQAGTTTGIVETTGLAALKRTSISKIDLIEYDQDSVSGAAAKVYIKNTSSATDEYIQVFINSVELGRLYGGDWMFVPWTGGSGEDIEVQPSSTDPVTIEYMALYG
jgi:hypothetical protein